LFPNRAAATAGGLFARGTVRTVHCMVNLSNINTIPALSGIFSWGPNFKLDYQTAAILFGQLQPKPATKLPPVGLGAMSALG
jgi:hypothetical protein